MNIPTLQERFTAMLQPNDVFADLMGNHGSLSHEHAIRTLHREITTTLPKPDFDTLMRGAARKAAKRGMRAPWDGTLEHRSFPVAETIHSLAFKSFRKV